MPKTPEIWIFAAVFSATLTLPVCSSAQTGEEGRETAGQADEDRSVRRLGDIVGSGGDDDFLMAIPEMNVPPPRQRPDVQLPDPQRDQRLQALLDRQAAAGDSAQLEAELARLMDEVRSAALDAVAAGALETARARQAVLSVLAPELGIQPEIDSAIAADAENEALMAQFAEALAAGRLVEPQADSALGYLERLRQADRRPGDLAPLAADLRRAMVERFTGLLDDGQVGAATEWLENLETVPVPARRLAELREQLQVQRAARAAELRRLFELALAAVEIDTAAALLERMSALDVDAAEVQAMRDRLSRIRRYGRFEPGQVFGEAVPGPVGGPEMVVIPTGSAMLGSPPDEAGRFAGEGPRFEAEFDSGFALSRTEITVAQFRAFVTATDYRTDAERNGESSIFDVRTGGITARRNVDWKDDFRGNEARGDDPVTHVSFNDARAYAAWLSEVTGQAYRLPTEAEFEYALRAGTQTRYWWGDAAPEDAVENLAGADDRFVGGQRWTDAFAGYRDGSWGPAPAGSFSPNPFGLFDIGGNQLEWVADCWIDDYSDPPVDGLARIVADCDRRVLRGGAWSNAPRMSRSAYRLAGRSDFSGARVGFRVARELRERDADSEAD